MTETTLKFGPEWLRALSHGSGSGGGAGGGGSSLISPPTSPGSLNFQSSLGLPKYKLAEHRFGREEMLALYEKGLVPEGMTNDPTIFVENVSLQSPSVTFPRKKRWPGTRESQ